LNSESDNQVPPVVEVADLTKVFRDFWRRPKIRAVDGISFGVRPGEIFGLLGPNGSGKSTTLKILLGLLHPTTGAVRVFNRSPRDIATKSRIGYLPEDSYLYDYLTPRETLDFYGRLFDLDAATRETRIDQLLDMLRLTEAARRRVGEFSKGMARRIGLAQALINDPALVILDEPTSGLDPIGCRQVKDLMLTLAGRGKTVVLSSHLLADVEDVCDRIAILYRGRILATGSVHDLLERQDNVRLTLPALPPRQMRDVLSAIRRQVGTEAEVDHPSLELEKFFLDVIERAYREGGGREDAGGACPVADYLAGGNRAPGREA
jgi:ABC-2 type transport system ATP-binding protein